MDESVLIELTVNGQHHEVRVEPRLLLIHLLRDVLELRGSNVGCDTTSCGACTVLLDGESVKACTVLAVQANGRAVTTIEGLSVDGTMHPMQRAFHECHALQCGFCTPGMVMAAISLCQENPSLSRPDVRRGLEGNLCRCTGYQNIVSAVIQGAEGTRRVRLPEGRPLSSDPPAHESSTSRSGLAGGS